MKKIIVVGSINMDIVSRVEILPGPGQGVMGPNFQYIPGGKGANQAVAASRLGGGVSFLGKIGRDNFGKIAANFLKREKLQLHNLGVSKSSPTGASLVIVDRNGTNMLIAASGANFDISIQQIKSLPIQRGDIILSTLEIPQSVTKNLFQRARARGTVTILNAAPAVSASRQLLNAPDYLVVNEHELAFFTGSKKISRKPADLMRAIRKLGRKGQTIIVTLGQYGLVCAGDYQQITIPGHRVKAVDTTAAGDCFVGAFAVALTENQNLKAALKFANAAAAVSVQKFGASSSLPRRQQVSAFIKKHPIQ